MFSPFCWLSDSLAIWFPVALAHWLPGSLNLWFPGSLGSLVPFPPSPICPLVMFTVTAGSDPDYSLLTHWAHSQQSWLEYLKHYIIQSQYHTQLVLSQYLLSLNLWLPGPLDSLAPFPPSPLCPLFMFTVTAGSDPDYPLLTHWAHSKDSLDRECQCSLARLSRCLL